MTIFNFIDIRLIRPCKRRLCTVSNRVCIIVLFICIWFLALKSIISQVSKVNVYMEPSAPRTGLKAEGALFALDGKPFTILSGAIHYFRIVPEYWEDRLLKLKALGLNTVETYVPWNLHEPTPGNFVFDGIADIKAYIQLAQKLGLYVIIRPGPYICAEWEFGGLPSWLLHDPEMQIRSFTPLYLKAIDDYFSTLIPLLAPLQYKNGGPIIAFQIENEYGNYGDNSYYMKYLYDVFTLRGVTELLFTSNSLAGARKALLPSVLMTINFQSNPEQNLQGLREIQPEKPLMVMEFWPGWFDHWGEKHKVMNAEEVVGIARNILKNGSSINFYMFHGGTNFGFMNGGNHDAGYLPTITSYDYDCPVSETGDITPKYLKLHELLKELRPVLHTDTIPDKIDLPKEIMKSAYGTVMMTQYVGFEDIVNLIGKTIESEYVVPIENLPINNDAGQSYGYTLYRTTLPNSAHTLDIKELRDYGQVFLNGETKGIVTWPEYDGNFNIETSSKGSHSRPILDIFVENCGRVNYGMHIVAQKKGILGGVTINEVLHKHWKIVPFELKADFVIKLGQSDAIWGDTSSDEVLSKPALFKGTFTVSGKPADTFLDTRGWHKGVAFINGHNLGRYWKIGPQETLYVPAPWLKEGINVVLIFEQHPRSSIRSVRLLKEHRLGPTVEHVPLN
ncbi:beta-galactosidase-1-like protein 2 [Dendronephthya gigantea]|uniref:beta-galactosidase-1-like protein 2 n=1 Tax=Dendronephthya gigantea TaxID=151771 RepID=UPI00106AE88D|nr:beta-galactosidase-1-like protein 2 [Dendronephthya gigantea]